MIASWIRADGYYGRSKDVYKFGMEKTPIVLYRDTLYEFSAKAGVPESLVPFYESNDEPVFTSFGDHFIIYSGHLGEHPFIFDLEKEMGYPLYRIKYESSGIDKERSTLEVSDTGVFVGLMTHKGLLGKGIAYTKVSSNRETANLEYGSDRITVYLGSNGSAYQLIDGKNVPVEIKPLPGGVPIAGTKLLLKGQTTPTPTASPTPAPTVPPTPAPTAAPTAVPTATPMAEPAAAPMAEPTATPMAEPAAAPMAEPTAAPMAEPTAVPAEEPVSEDGLVRIVCGEGEQAVLYQGPGTSFTPLAALGSGTPVQVILYDGAWAYVIAGARNGFLESRFLAASDPAPGNGATPVPPLPTAAPQPVFIPTPSPAAQRFPGTAAGYPREAVTNIKKVNVRVGTSTESQRVRQLIDPGTGVTVLNDARSADGTLWYFVQLNTGETGYIRGDLLSFASGRSSSYGTSTVMDADHGDFRTVSASLIPGISCGAYSGPGEYYLRGANGKAYMATSDTVYLYGRENGWLLVQYSISASQYRFAYVRENAVVSPEAVASLQFQWIPAALAWDCAITDDPLHSASPLISASAGTSVYFLARLDSWAYIECGNVRGFVPYHSLSFVN